jgi:hypothetical protein
MSHTLTIRISDELAAWLEETARRRGMPKGRIVREQLERARRADPGQPWMHLAGRIRGARDLSTRKGFSRS